MTQDADKEIITTNSRPGYKHTMHEGTCGKDVTLRDIKNRIYHPMFGGRSAWVGNGKWRAIRHND